MTQIAAATLITFNPPAVREDESVSAALELICQWQLSELPVINRNQQVLGVLQLAPLVDLVSSDRGYLASPVDLHITARPDPFQPQRFPQIALQQLLAQQLRALPVVEDGKLIGSLGRTDFLREFAMMTSRLAQSEVLDHCVPAGECLEANATVDEAFAAMDAERAEHVCVVQSGCPLAACTRHELQWALQIARVEEFLGGPPSSCQSVIRLIRSAPHLQPGQSMADAAQSMFEIGSAALLVVNKANRILGAITESIVLSALLRGGV